MRRPTSHDALITAVDPLAATRADLERVHPVPYLDRIEGICAAGGGRLDPDTYASAGTWHAATLAAGAGLTAAGSCSRATATRRSARCGRPAITPTNRVDGLLLHQQRGGRRRVAGRPGRASDDLRLRRASRQRHAGRVLPRPARAVREPASVAAVPGHGPAHRGGRGAGRGVHAQRPAAARRHRRRLPLRVRSSWCAPVADRFAPTWVIMSAGFDAHRFDPITELALTSGDYARSRKRILSVGPPGVGW
jgi:acetoin utilization deacetylase AcuC-like enzyme